MRARLHFGRGPQIVAAGLFVLILVSTVLAAAGLGGSGSPTPASNRPSPARGLAGLPEHGTYLGDTHAPATLVEFADLQCPFCGRYTRNALPSLLEKWVRPGRLRFELRLLTFIGPESERAARLADAAGLQHRLWLFSELFFLNQPRENSGLVTQSYLRRLAAATPGLNVARAFAARDSRQVDRQLARAKRTAEQLGVKSTPAFFLMRPGRPAVPVRPRAFTAAGMTTAIEHALRAGTGP